jgi:hypothetical protein
MEPRPQELPFTIRRIGSNVWLVQLERDGSLTGAQADAIHAAGAGAMRGTRLALLVEKTRRDSFPLEALRRLIEQPSLFALAFHVGGDAQPFPVEMLLAVTARTRAYPAAIFRSRAEAIEWLAQQGAEFE